MSSTLTTSPTRRSNREASDSLKVQIAPEALGKAGALLVGIRQALDDLTLSTQARADVLADLDTAEAQLRKPRPNVNVLRTTLQSLYTGMAVAAGTAIGRVLLAQLEILIRAFRG